MSVKYVLLRSRESFILDNTVLVAIELVKHLCQEVHVAGKAHATDNSLSTVAMFYKQQKGILVTANPEYLDLLNDEGSDTWGVLLLPRPEPDSYSCCNDCSMTSSSSDHRSGER